VCGVSIFLAPLSSLAFAADSGGVPAAQAAAKLARIIRRDAHQQHGRFPGAVTVTRRCCGVRVLRVHYHAAARQGVSDVYVLRLVTRAGELEGVALFEHPSEARREPTGAVLRATSDYAFAIERGGSGGGWHFGASSDEATSFSAGGGARGGASSSFECRSFHPLRLALYERALTSLSRAKRHRAGAFRRLARSACEMTA
jgi:uncharacterized membrane protein YgcG